jgi:hypothetical protein
MVVVRWALSAQMSLILNVALCADESCPFSTAGSSVVPFSLPRERIAAAPDLGSAQQTMEPVFSRAGAIERFLSVSATHGSEGAGLSLRDEPGRRLVHPWLQGSARSLSSTARHDAELDSPVERIDKVIRPAAHNVLTKAHALRLGLGREFTLLASQALLHVGRALQGQRVIE